MINRAELRNKYHNQGFRPTSGLFAGYSFFEISAEDTCHDVGVIVRVGTLKSINAAYHTAAILKKNKLHHMRYKQKNKIKKKLLSFSICVVYMAMKITHK